MDKRMRPRLPILALALLCAPSAEALAAAPSREIDLAAVPPGSPQLRRVLGSVGDGTYGVPVAGGIDVDGDGHRDTAFAAMIASPLGRTRAGQVFLVFGDSTLGAELDTAALQADVLQIFGDGNHENAGSELWMDDVDGDGYGDLLIARQNHDPDPPNRPGAGALTILFGGPALRSLAATLADPAPPDALDLRAPDPALTLLTLVGPTTLGRLGIWMRTGDVTGDGIADIVVGADQVNVGGEPHTGEVYVVRGGPHLAVTQTIDLASFGATALAGHIARIRPPAGATHYHFGATVQIADLDGNGKGEVLAAAALNRAGASLPADGQPAGTAHPSGGSADGTLYIAWDDNFTGNPWTPGLSFVITSSPGGRSVISGAPANAKFGEEILGGLDYDEDGDADLFVGDITGDWSGKSRFNSGVGHVLYDAAALQGLTFSLASLPPGVTLSTFLGGAPQDVAADTALHGDFDCDGIDDLSFSSPHADPFGRTNAGTLHVFFGRAGGWPASIDLKTGELPDPSLIRITNLYGAHGQAGSDAGDTLAYSATARDLNADGCDDLITNEMQGNGSSLVDAGNLILFSGRWVAGAHLVPSGTPLTSLVLAAAFLAAGLQSRRRLR